MAPGSGTTSIWTERRRSGASFTPGFRGKRSFRRGDDPQSLVYSPPNVRHATVRHATLRHATVPLAPRATPPTAPAKNPSFMKIWIDADAAPRDVKEITARAAQRLELSTVLVANQRLWVPPGNPFVEAIRVEGGPDVADAYIVEHATPGDLAITADIPLAALLVAKGVWVLDHRGEAFSESNIGERLSIRNFMDDLRSTGVETGGPPPYSARDKRAFAGALDRTLTRIARTGGSGGTRDVAPGR